MCLRYRGEVIPEICRKLPRDFVPNIGVIPKYVVGGTLFSGLVREAGVARLRGIILDKINPTSGKLGPGS